MCKHKFVIKELGKMLNMRVRMSIIWSIFNRVNLE